jgi:asparagine synthase (glutamine-hydrolysing)
MCGIVGVVSRRDPVAPEVVLAMRDALTHRGPDSAGAWTEAAGRVGLGHRRLAIVDLTATGHQPMIDPATGCVIAFNGEIYNHRELRAELADAHAFRGGSDTEALLAAYVRWGAGCVARLRGMFAFAIWDPRARVLFAARDRAGEKPFYYQRHAGGLRFASELKGLMADAAFPRRVEADALRQFLAHGYVPAPGCIFAGVNKLPPAHTLTYRADTGELETRRYWQPPPAPDARAALDEEALTNELGARLDAAVRRQLVADVPVGILLSGGVDSGLVTALAARAGGPRVRTFTLAFPGHGRFDEAPHAAAIARHFGTEHHELVAEPAALDLLPQLAAQFDEPMVDSSMIPTLLVSRLIRGHAKVALGGDGGDELFGGYATYARLDRLARLAARTPLPRGAQRAAAAALQRRWGEGARGRSYLPALRDLIDGRLPDVRRLFFDDEVAALLPGAGPTLAPPRGDGELIDRLCRDDFSRYLAEDILTKVDRASMLASLEVRAPWLDPDVIEFAFGRVPVRLKTTGRERKILPKRLARRLFPAGYDYARKQGFSLPIAAWFRQGGAAPLADIVRDHPVPALAPAAVAKVLAAGRRGAAPEKVFGLALLGLWARHYRVSFA